MTSSILGQALQEGAKDELRDAFKRCQTDAAGTVRTGDYSAAGARQVGSPSRNENAADLEIHFALGCLSIRVRGANLGQVLSGAAQAASTTVNGSAGVEPVFGEYCGTPDEVFEQLLNGSEVQYVLTLSKTVHGAVDEVLLTPKPLIESSPPLADGPQGLIGREESSNGLRNQPALRPVSQSIVQEQSSSATAGGAVPEDPLLIAPVPPIPTQVDMPKAKGDDAVKPAGAYLQELYKLREQLQPSTPPR